MVNKIRGFEVVSDSNRKHPFDTVELPVRGTVNSAGYDIKIPVGIHLEPNEKKLVWTDIKAYMVFNEVLKLYPRSGLATKKGVVLANLVPIIDADYYHSDNEGNIGLMLWNTSSEVVELTAGERVAQGIFQKYLTVDEDISKGKRTGGFGSTGK